tara:strand:+ start:10556 stop:10774 length:219 start_codon:yes stop_codon:yes gene_type:complete
MGKKILPAYIVRMKDELYALDDKLSLAEEFRETHIFSSLAQGEQNLLNQQIKHMRSYADVLAKRIELAEARK